MTQQDKTTQEFWANQMEWTTIQAFSDRGGVTVTSWHGGTVEFPRARGRVIDAVKRYAQRYADDIGWSEANGFTLGSVRLLPEYGARGLNSGHYIITVWRDKAYKNMPFRPVGWSEHRPLTIREASGMDLTY